MEFIWLNIQKYIHAMERKNNLNMHYKFGGLDKSNNTDFKKNVLFLTLANIKSNQDKNIYMDLMREFIKNDYHVYVISPVEKKQNIETHIIHNDHLTILKLRTGNIFNTNFIEKGISTITIERIYKNGIKKYCNNTHFDLVLYSTPPITLQKVVNYVKKRDNAIAYLLLKDIFPQNALDLGILKKTGIHGLIYRYFRNKEKKLYDNSDYIGCMSPANVDYLINNNKYIAEKKVNIVPNCVEVDDKQTMNEEEKTAIRSKYNLPNDKKIFVYGGNLGKPQGIDFMLECLNKAQTITNAHFLIVGSGTEYNKIEQYINNYKLNNVTLHQFIKKEEYDKLIQSCDVGLIFLDYRFTIPNFPSRLLSYMQAKIPVIAATDPNTDVGKIIEQGGFGYSCMSNNVEGFLNAVSKIINDPLEKMGEIGFEYLKNHYSSSICYKEIMQKIGTLK